jgi:hypothetical protein
MKRLLNFFNKSKKTKWIPLHSYEKHCDAYLILCRKNRNGLIQFKTVNISTSCFYIKLGLNAEEQFRLLNNIKYDK